MRSPTFAEWRDGGRSFQYRQQHPIFYQSGGDGSGQGAALVCLHGFPTASWGWHRLWLDLCRQFAVVRAPDLIGFGWSAKPRSYAYSIFDQADLVEQLLQTHNLRRCHILAHDYGVTVAQELLARLLNRGPGYESLTVESVCFLNGGLIPEAHRPRPAHRLMLSPLAPLTALLMTRRRFVRNLEALFGPRSKPSDQDLDCFWQLARHNGGEHVTQLLARYVPERLHFSSRWVEAMQTSDVPMRFIMGLEDPVSGAEMVTRVRAVLPTADIVELPGIGHYPQLEQPQAVLRAFDEFHERLAARVLS